MPIYKAKIRYNLVNWTFQVIALQKGFFFQNPIFVRIRGFQRDQGASAIARGLVLRIPKILIQGRNAEKSWHILMLAHLGNPSWHRDFPGVKKKKHSISIQLALANFFYPNCALGILVYFQWQAWPTTETFKGPIL